MKIPIPAAKKTYSLDFPLLSGGLNTRDLNYRMPPNQSPYMKNLWWEDGVLQCRPGQRSIRGSAVEGKGYSCFSRLFHGRAFFHIGTAIYYSKPSATAMELTSLATGVPELRGTFFRYQDWLMYKTRGAFYRIEYQPEIDDFSVKNVADLAYTPVIAINCAPETGAGATYQPENRLSPKKTLKYNAKSGETKYHLPVKPIDSIVEVKVDGKATTEYSVDLTTGVVTFNSAPPVVSPPVNNTVEITYSKANEDALNGVMDCRYAFVAGGDQNLCILLAGSTKQPNAVFWNANDSLSMNPAYWPITTYNLVGPTNDPVTGFGAQYKDTICFKAHSIGKLNFEIDTVEKRDIPLFKYEQINDKQGCDLPWTIQLVENNLVFANTYQGVHVLRSSSAAFENNVECISLRINEPTNTDDEARYLPGLLADAQAVTDPDSVCSWDDDTRYWLCGNDHAYLWDYDVSDQKDPSWFYFTAMSPICFWADDGHKTYHLNAEGDITALERTFTDYGAAIDKVYQFPTQSFGSYERLKDVTDVLFATRSDTQTLIKIRYDTDYETRYDLTDISNLLWRLGTLDLTRTILGYYNGDIPRYARVAKRRPKCRHIRHFALSLSNDRPNEDLAIVSAQILYNFQGKER